MYGGRPEQNGKTGSLELDSKGPREVVESGKEDQDPHLVKRRWKQKIQLHQDQFISIKLIQRRDGYE